MLGHFIRAQFTLSGLAMVVMTVLSIMGVPYAFALGPAAGALEFIPVVGPALGGLIVLAVALLSGYNHMWVLLIFLLVWRCIQDYVTSPRIMGRSLELHPLAILFGVFAGGEVAGVIGVFLSIPVLATLRILWHTWMLYRKQGRRARRKPGMVPGRSSLAKGQSPHRAAAHRLRRHCSVALASCYNRAFETLTLRAFCHGTVSHSDNTRAEGSLYAA